MISLILPVFNSFSATAGSLPALIERLKDLGLNYEIILVDDHSLNPKPFIEIAAENQILCLTNEKNYGKGYSVRKGFAHATGSILIFMDGDFPFELDVIDRMCETFKNENIDIVIGDRSLVASVYPAETTWLRKTGSSVLSFFAARYITPGFTDTQCGIKGFRKEAARDIFPDCVVNGFSFDMEILFIAIRKKLSICKIPVRAKKQNGSNVSVFYHGIEMLFNIVRIYLRKWRGLYKL